MDGAAEEAHGHEFLRRGFLVGKTTTGSRQAAD
jgi:hypothetical protein